MEKDKNKEFELASLPVECQDPSISKDDFKLVQADEKIHDQKFETKPTTFLKDCLKRFRKNKSSVVAAFILGILLLMSVVVPVFFKTSDIHDTKTSHPEIYYLEPKLFKAGTGFWDGTKKMTNIAVDTSDPDKANWGPDYERYNKNAVSKLEIGEEQYTESPNKYAHGGYIQFGYFSNIPASEKYIRFATDLNKGEFKFDYDITINDFVTFDLAKLAASDEKTKTYPEGYVDADSALYFTFEEGVESYSVLLSDYAKAHNDSGINVKAKFDDEIARLNAEEGLSLTDEISNPRFEIRVKNAGDNKNACTLIKSITIVSSSTDSDERKAFEAFSFKDGNDVYIRTANSSGVWKNFSDSKYSRETNYLVRAVLCSFVYDTYEAVLGSVTQELFATELQAMKNKGYIKYTAQPKNEKVDGKWVTDETTFKCEILNETKCPLVAPFKAEDVIYDEYGLIDRVKCNVYKYKLDPYNLDKMPTFLLGTDKSGRDMFIYVFEGLRTSLLLGIVTSAVCFLFGLLWGSISGYFGGTVDLAMERFTDILSGVPWIVVMTLTIIHLGSTFFTFALALCLTGWIGTSHITRTQFYRFRGREYVLASRTLGASHARLIAKHILPNAIGTIITSAVLMVPSIIFSEATISYLGLGFKNLASLGVILSDNQVELTNHPYLLIFPAIIIALLMISFNLFGNGLRDAVNPSLKGEGE